MSEKKQDTRIPPKGGSGTAPPKGPAQQPPDPLSKTSLKKAKQREKQEQASNPLGKLVRADMKIRDWPAGVRLELTCESPAVWHGSLVVGGQTFAARGAGPKRVAFQLEFAWRVACLTAEGKTPLVDPVAKE